MCTKNVGSPSEYNMKCVEHGNYIADSDPEKNTKIMAAYSQHMNTRSLKAHTPVHKYKELPFHYHIDWSVVNDWETLKIDVGKKYLIDTHPDASTTHGPSEWAGFMFDQDINFAKRFEVGYGPVSWRQSSGLYEMSRNDLIANGYDHGNAETDPRVCKRLPRPSDGYGAYAHYVEFGDPINGTMRTDGS
jgi:hypothetical protein